MFFDDSVNNDYSLLKKNVQHVIDFRNIRLRKKFVRRVKILIFCFLTKLILAWFDRVFHALQNGIKISRKNLWPGHIIGLILVLTGFFWDFCPVFDRLLPENSRVEEELIWYSESASKTGYTYVSFSTVSRSLIFLEKLICGPPQAWVKKWVSWKMSSI